MSQRAVLVVDDDLFIRDLLKAQLTSKGLYTIEAANGLEALHRAEVDRPLLIVLDIMMPGMSGFDVCERLRSNPQTGNVPILFISSRSDQADRQRAMRLGALDLLVKPFSLQKFSDKVLEIVAKP